MSPPPAPADAVRSPREIVARLHRQIAAKSAEHAALVAEFEGLRRAVPGDGREAGGLARGAQTTAACREQMRRYAALRASGLDRAQAAAEMGVSVRTVERYDGELYLATMPGQAKEAA